MTAPVEIGPLINHANGNGDPELGHSTDGGYVYGITSHRYQECNDYDCRPVIVVGTCWDDALAFTRRMRVHAPGDSLQPTADHVQKAIRASVAPVRSQEPLRIGAVVEQADGERWTRTGTAPNGDWVNASGSFADWADICPALKLQDGLR